MLNFFNKRFFIIFLFPLFLGGLTVLSFPPFNFFFINFLSLTLLFFSILYVKKKSKSVYRKKPFLKNLFILGTSYGFGYFFFGIYWIAYSLTFDSSFKFLIPFSLFLIPLFLSLFFSLPILIVGNYCEKNFSSILLRLKVLISLILIILFTIAPLGGLFLILTLQIKIWGYQQYGRDISCFLGN